MKKIFISLILGIFLLGNVAAFAVSSEYWDQNPIVMSPGEEREIFVTLQNMAGDVSLDAQGTIIEGKELVSLIEGAKIYTVPSGQKVQVHMKVLIPMETPNGRHNAVISFKTTEEGTGDFNFGNSVEREIPIIVQAHEKQKSQTGLYWIIGILGLALIAALIFIILSRKKRR